MENKPVTVRFGLVFVGLLFFCNPYFAGLDVLPDCIGCLLICWGLSRLALLYPFVADVQKAFLKLACVDAVKMLLLAIVFSSGYGSAEQPTALLVIAFAAAVVGLFFLLPALRRLFDAFYALLSHYDCKYLYGNPYGGLSKTDAICRFSMIFVVVREIVCLLPELTALTTSSFTDSDWDVLYQYIGIMRLLACFIVAIVGLVWVVFLALYFRRVGKEKEMCIDLGTRARDHYVSHPGIKVKRRHAVSFVLMSIGALFLTDFYVDFENIIPDPVAGVLIAVGALLAMTPALWRALTAIFGLLYGVISYVSSDLNSKFVLNFSPGAIGKNHEADLAYTEMWVWSLIELLLFIGLLVSVLMVVRGVVVKWAGYRAEHTESEFEQRNHKNMLSSFDGQLLICAVLGFFSAILSFLYDYIQTPSGKGIYHFLDYLWIFDFTLNVIFAGFFAVVLVRIFAQIKNRFQYD